ncbi:carbohydrate ABC transporter permease [Vallitalea okinawensis]|uniref:carbohydrate ABC transporter permease n=1 Tax=Vallitalea okinawensis TaxID=2078660 RepID=UPI000CFDAC14|nr:carbohydrate ABC transporter permease [Vallitalea okinawensis]
MGQSKSRGKTITNYVLMAVILLIFTIPLYWLVIGSVKTNMEFNQVPPTFWPKQFELGNYLTAWKQLDFKTAFINSSIVTVVCTVLNIITGVLAGYVLSKKNVFGGKLILGMIIATLIVPPAVLLLPLYFIITKMGMYDSLIALVLPFAANAYTIYFMKQYIDDIPNELFEAASIDGIGEVGMMMKIVFPLITPALATVGLINFVGNWNSFTMPLVLLRSDEKFTLPLKQALLANATDVNEWPLILAATVLSIIPVLIVFIGSQKMFVKGIMEGAVKG